MKAKDFEIISVAEDAGGAGAAGPWIDRAKPTYTVLIDPTHKVSSLYNLVNVPSAVWINEQGRVLRVDEGTYASTIKIGSITVGTDDYAPAVRDWIARGAKSRYVWSPEQVATKIRRRSSDEQLAEPTFKLGVYFFQKQDPERARLHWKRAEELFPDSWNMHRQDWTFTAEGSGGKSFQEKRKALGDKPYYAPFDFPTGLEVPPASAGPPAR